MKRKIKSESDIRFEKIIKGIKSAIAEVYENARKNGTELVISKKPGVVQNIKIK